MAKTKEKAYAIRAFLKPKSDGLVRYMGKSFKGFAFGKNPEEAKEKTINLLIDSFKHSDTKVTREDISIKECKLYNDFIVTGHGSN